MRYLIFFLLGFSLSLHGKAPQPTSETPNKASFFAMHYAGYRYQLSSDSRNLLVGNAMQLQVGYGKLREHTFWESGIGLLVGPFTPNPDLPLLSTSQGFGAYTTMGWIARDQPFRNPHGPVIGLQCGLHYIDFTQRSVANTSTQGNIAPYVGMISARSMRVTDLSLYPGFFLSWLPTPPRPDMVHPDSAKTRIEGYWIQIGFGFPLYTRYDERYLDSGMLNADGTPSQQRHTGALHGYTTTISLTVLLGV